MGKDTVVKKDSLPDVEPYFEDIVYCSLLVPVRGNPNSPDCMWGLPCIFWGLSGIAKTGRIELGAAKAGLHCEVVYPATKQPEDFSGVLVPGPKGITIECMMPAIRKLMEVGSGVLVIDEASCAPPAVQGAAMSTVYERKVGDMKMSNNIRILLAANPPEHAAGGWALEAAFANRMAHFNIGVMPVDKWGEYLMSEDDDVAVTPITDGEELVKKNWNRHWAAVKGSLYAFMRSNNSVFHSQPTPGSPAAGLPWPSPRTWYMAGRAIATVRCLGLPKQLETILVQGLVGEGASTEWAAWEADADLPDPLDVLEKGWKVDSKRLDRSIAVCGSFTALVVGTTDKSERVRLAALAWERLFDMTEAGLTDIAGRAVRVLINKKLGRKDHASLEAVAAKVVLKVGLSDASKYL